VEHSDDTNIAFAPCCAADGTLWFPDSCPAGGSALAMATIGNNYYSPHAAACAVGNAAAARVQSWSDATLLLLTFASSPAVGTWSDTAGRRTVLVASEVAHLMPAVALLLWAYAGVSIYAFFVVRSMTGAINSLACCLAYVADVTSPLNRAPAFGLLLATASMGVVAAPIGAQMEAPSLAVTAVTMHLACVAFAALLLPESLSLERRQNCPANPGENSSGVISNSVGSAGCRALARGLDICRRSTLSRRLTAVLVLSGAANRGLQDVTR